MTRTDHDLTVYHIPICPFSQRLEILLSLKGLRDKVHFEVIDLTKPYPDALTEKLNGSMALPVLETADGHILKESLVLMQYLEDLFPEPAVAQVDPYQRAVENMFVRFEDSFTTQGYLFVMNQDLSQRASMREAMLAQYAQINDFLLEHATTESPFLFDRFGWTEAVYTPMFMRFWFLEYYEDFQLPDEPRYARVTEWQSACLAHPAAQQVSREEIVKCYYDYARGAGNAALLPGRRYSSFVFEPSWRERPWPPSDKYGYSATDEELGLLPAT